MQLRTPWIRMIYFMIDGLVVKWNETHHFSVFQLSATTFNATKTGFKSRSEPNIYDTFTDLRLYDFCSVIFVIGLQFTNWPPGGCIDLLSNQRDSSVSMGCNLSSLSLSLSLSHIHTLSLSLTLCQRHTCTHPHSLSLSISCPLHLNWLRKKTEVSIAHLILHWKKKSTAFQDSKSLEQSEFELIELGNNHSGVA